MPVTTRSPIRRLSQAEFGDLRFPGVELEFPIEVSHATFKKVQYIDVLVSCGGPFEFKTVDAITPRHPAQLLHYMLLVDLGHGKLVNLRRESVQHEFVNTTLRREDRVRFGIRCDDWDDGVAGARL